MDMTLEAQRHGVFLPERSVIAFTGEARYAWKHGIERRVADYVGFGDGEDSWVDRGTRLSVTFRWMLPGADVVGGEL